MSKKLMVFFLVAFLFGLCSTGPTLAITLQVSILNPASGSQHREGTTIFFQGEGFVTETNFKLEGGDLEWYANGQFIGRGSFVNWKPGPGSYTVALQGEKEGERTVDEIEINVTSVLQPIQSGDVASYNFATNTLYIPFLAGGVAYWVNMAVTSFASPLTFVLTGLGVAEFSPTADYARFGLFSNTVYVPVFMDEEVSYFMSLRITNSVAPLTFELRGSGLNP